MAEPLVQVSNKNQAREGRHILCRGRKATVVEMTQRIKGLKGRHTRAEKMSSHQQLLYHVVFSTKNRKRYLADGFRESLFSYMAGTALQLGGFAFKVGGYYDHVHLLLRIPAKTAVSKFVGQLKSSTSKHVNDSSSSLLKFGWQDGFGAFSVSISNKERVARYIANQMEHHKEVSFQDEYVLLLKRHQVEFDPERIWD